MTTLSLPSPADVRFVITTSLSDEGVQAFIDDAVVMASPCVNSYEPARQRTLLKWLTAHLINSAPANGSGSGGQLLASQRLGDASETYVNPASSAVVGLESTAYGRQALALDTGGCLTALGQKPVIVQSISPSGRTRCTPR